MDAASVAADSAAVAVPRGGLSRGALAGWIHVGSRCSLGRSLLTSTAMSNVWIQACKILLTTGFLIKLVSLCLANRTNYMNNGLWGQTLEYPYNPVRSL